MSIAIVTSSDEAKEWKIALTDRLPNVSIEIVSSIEQPSKAPFLICWKPTKGQLNNFPNLRVIQSLGAGVDHIFEKNTIPEGVQIVRIIDERLSEDMWEYLLAATMQHLKDFRQYEVQKRTTTWQRHAYRRVPDTTVSILGLGKIGGYVAEKFSRVGFQVQGWSNSPKNLKGVRSFTGDTDLPFLLKNTDILINLLPLTPATQGILNRPLFQQLPSTSYLINAGRGGHLVDEDLLAVLELGYLSGATLDVFHHEPLPSNHPFWQHPKILVTPHVASLTDVNSAINQVVDNYQRMIRGTDLLNKITVDKGY
ncbi:MAG: glyoxylate/hydroxypyruvate reductase A [Bacteroidota bacterium]